MELYQLRSFTAVAELGHLTRAAEKLHVSQPAMSAQIKALEDELGIALFERVPTGMMLTAAGRRLLPQAAKVVAAANALRGNARAIQGEVAGESRVGTLSDPDFIRLGDFLARAIERFPRLEVKLHHEVTGTAFEKVRDGALDASFYYGDRTDPAVAAIALREIAYRVAAPAAWRERIAHAGWDEIAAQPWIIAPPISTHHALATALFRANGVTPATLIEVDNEAVIRSLVAAGLGMALVREDIVLDTDAGHEFCVWSEARLATTLQFIYSRARHDEPEVHSLLLLIEDVWGVAVEPNKTASTPDAAAALADDAVSRAA